MVPELGVIEGYFGRPWSHEDRRRVLIRLRELGYSWFHYAPKADAFLRRRWREPHPSSTLTELADLSTHCRDVGLRFGVGLSPYELYRDFSGPAQKEFVAKIRALDAIGIDDLAILFDDTRGDVPDLAAREAEIVHTALANTRARRVLMCPTYYSDDRMLDVVFGERPPGYLEDLGRRLDPQVGVITNPVRLPEPFSGPALQPAERHRFGNVLRIRHHRCSGPGVLEAFQRLDHRAKLHAVVRAPTHAT
jgi:hypothetical protein